MEEEPERRAQQVTPADCLCPGARPSGFQTARGPCERGASGTRWDRPTPPHCRFPSRMMTEGGGWGGLAHKQRITTTLGL